MVFRRYILYRLFKAHSNKARSGRTGQSVQSTKYIKMEQYGIGLVGLTASQIARKFYFSLAGASLCSSHSNYWLQFERRVVGRHAPILVFIICSQFFNNLFIENLQFVQIPRITGFYQFHRIFPFVIMHKNITAILCNFFSHFLLTNARPRGIIRCTLKEGQKERHTP